MARPTTRLDLIEAANRQFDKLWSLIGSMPGDEKNVVLSFGDDFSGKEAHWERDKNLRDVYIHLYEWHKLLLNWVSSNRNGEPKPFLPEPYNWKTYALMNVEFWEKHQATGYQAAADMVKQSHADVMAMIESFSDDELFSKKRFSWTGTTSLGSYCVSATVGHYDWAIKKINQHIKAGRKDRG